MSPHIRIRQSAPAAKRLVVMMLVLLVAVSAPIGSAEPVDAATLITRPIGSPVLPSRQAPTTAMVAVDCYYDVDTDGVRDPDETGLSGYSFRLLDASGTPVRSGMTGKRALVMTRIVPGDYTLLQLHPDEAGAWFNTTGNPRTPLALRARDRRGVITGTAYTENGYLLPRSSWVAYPGLIEADTLAEINALAPFAERPFQSAEGLSAFLAVDAGDPHGRLAQELATFVLGFSRLSGSTRCAIAHEQRWKEAALLCDEAASSWESDDASRIEAMSAALSAHNTGPVAYVPLQAPVPIY